MPIQPYRQGKLEEVKKRAARLYKQGFTTREVGRILNRSHAWVATVVKEIGKYL